MQSATVDQDKLEQFMDRFVQEMGAAVSAPLVLIGDRLGLYRQMCDAGPLTSTQLAERAGCDERYVREWLSAQAASGYVTYDPVGDTFTLPPEQAMCFAIEDSPVYLPGAFQIIASMYSDADRIADAFVSGAGLGWHEHSHELFEGTERFFRPGYNAHLVAEWIPALDGVQDKLEHGASVADLGCGRGASTVIMAQAFPGSRFCGFDYHEQSIAAARAGAREAGVEDRVSFERAWAQDFPGEGYDLIAIFDALHDMGDPVGAARHVRERLAPDGTWMIVEPFAGDELKDNLNPVGRLYYSASTFVCTPSAKSQSGGLALGAQAGERRIREVAQAAGFTRFRRAAETPFNTVFEARP